jgi:hypothetical protein
LFRLNEIFLQVLRRKSKKAFFFVCGLCAVDAVVMTFHFLITPESKLFYEENMMQLISVSFILMNIYELCLGMYEAMDIIRLGFKEVEQRC